MKNTSSLSKLLGLEFSCWWAIMSEGRPLVLADCDDDESQERGEG
jgi:hypothetical protein